MGAARHYHVAMTQAHERPLPVLVLGLTKGPEMGTFRCTRPMWLKLCMQKWCYPPACLLPCLCMRARARVWVCARERERERERERLCRTIIALADLLQP